MAIAVKEKMTSEQKELTTDNIRLAYYAAKQWQKRFNYRLFEYDDLVQICSIGLIKASIAFKIERNVKFATFAMRCMSNEVLMEYRRLKNIEGKIISYDELAKRWVEGGVYEGDLTSDEVVSFLAKHELKIQESLFYSCYDDIVQVVADEYSKLGDGTNYKKVVGAYMVNPELTQAQISKMVGISQSYVSRIRNKFKNKLHKKLMRQGLL